jgi:hypothetical protein
LGINFIYVIICFIVNIFFVFTKKWDVLYLNLTIILKIKHIYSLILFIYKYILTLYYQNSIKVIKDIHKKKSSYDKN